MFIKKRPRGHPPKITYFSQGMLVGFLATVLMVAILAIVLKKVFKAEVQNPTKSIVAPYYDPEVFTQRPITKNNLAHQAISGKTSLKIPIIMYHYVEYVQDIKDFIRKRLAINPYTFESQLLSLKQNNFDTYFVRDIPDILDGKIDYSTKSAILTFDDGYEDFYTDVFPLLKKYQMKATIYVICDFIDSRGFLKDQQIIKMIESGLVEIGDHTMDHLYLKNTQEAVAYKQIVACKDQLEKNYNIKVKTFAYPYGAFDERITKIVKEASFSAAVSVISGTMQSTDNLYFLSRIRSGNYYGPSLVNMIEKNNH